MYRVLLVDDEPLIVAGIKKKIDWNALGFEIVGSAGESDSALRLVDEHLPDLIILDIRIPKISGLEMMNIVKARYRCQFIVVSGFSDFNYAQRALQLGAIDYLVKPVAQSTLFDAVSRVKKTLDEDYASDTHLDENGLVNFIDANSKLLTDDEIAQKLGIKTMCTDYYCVSSNVAPIDNYPELLIRPVFWHEKTTTHLVSHVNSSVSPTKILDIIYPFTVAAISGPFHSLSALPHHVRQAQAILTCSFFNNRKLHFTQCSSNKTALTTLSTAFSCAISQQDAATCSSLLDSLPQVFIANTLYITDFERLFNDLIHNICATSTSDKPKYLSGVEIATQFDGVGSAIAYLRQLLYEALPSERTKGSNRQIALMIKDYIDKNFNEEFSLRELAETNYMDMSYLSTVFKNEVGETFVRYISRVRICHACEMLSATDLSADQIARLCGYSSFSYFNKVFKRAVGLTPTEYRNCPK